MGDLFGYVHICVIVPSKQSFDVRSQQFSLDPHYPWLLLMGVFCVSLALLFFIALQEQTNKRQSIHMSETPRGSWASSIFDLKQSQADTQLPNLFDRVTVEDVDRGNEIQRQQQRQDTLFSLYPPQEEVSMFETGVCTYMHL